MDFRSIKHLLHLIKISLHVFKFQMLTLQKNRSNVVHDLLISLNRYHCNLYTLMKIHNSVWPQKIFIGIRRTFWYFFTSFLYDIFDFKWNTHTHAHVRTHTRTRAYTHTRTDIYIFIKIFLLCECISVIYELLINGWTDFDEIFCVCSSEFENCLDLQFCII